MAESYSVKAVLSAVDRGFSAAFKSATSSMASLGDSIKSGLGFGVLMGAGQAAFSAISAGVSGIIGDMGEASAAWKTFEGNMAMNGTAASEIQEIKKELQDFATQTVYSASDMASTYAQLAAVGTKNTKKLVKGFGGLAAAAENPQQAMKTLSQQATQMAAKPTVAWEDFKLMLEQTPAGVAAVAKTMGMSTTEMIKSIQDGKLATEDFFNAVADTGTNANFTKLATEYKTVGQAMDGLTETMSTKLQPAFDTLPGYGIKAVGKLADSFEKIDGNALAVKISGCIDAVSPYWEVLKTNASDVGKAFGDAFRAIGDAFKKIIGVYDAEDEINKFTNVVGWAKEKLVSFAGFLEEHADTIAKVIKALPKLFLAYKGFKVLKGITSFAFSVSDALGRLSGSSNELGEAGKNGKKGSMTLKKGLGSLAKSSGIALIIASLAGLALAVKPLASLGTTAVAPLLAFGAAVGGLAVVFSKTGKQLQKSAKGIAVFAGALSVMALAMTPLASLGTTAIAPLATFGIVVGGLAAVFANTGKQLEKSVTGIIVFAAAVSVMALAMTPLASTGTEGAVAMATFGIVVAGLVAVFGLFGSALNVAIPGMLAFGATILMVGAGMAMASVFINSLTPFVKQLGDTFSQVADAIADAVSQIVTVVGDTLCNVMTTAGDVISKVVDSISKGFETITDGISGVIDSISGGFSSVLDSIAEVIESIGNSARNAGTGFKSVAEGISMIAELSIIDIAKSLGAVATGLGEMAVKGEGLQQAASGMAGISTSITSAASATAALNSLLFQISGVAVTASRSILSITAAFAGLKIPNLDVSPILAAFTAVIVAAAIMSKQVTTIGQRAGDGFTKSFSNSARQSISVANSISISIISTFMAASSGTYNCGYYIGIGLANGMRSSLNEVRAVATELAGEAEKAVRAKAKIKSPSRVFRVLGAYIGEGFAIGIDSMKSQVEHTSQELVAIPNVKTFSDFSAEHHLRAGTQELSNEYSYRPVIQVNAEVTSVMDGRAVGYGSAKYVDEKNQKAAKLKSQMMGVK